MKIESAVLSEGDHPGVQDEDKSLDTTQDSSGLANRIVVEDEDELPSRILNSSFNDTHSSSERTPEASRMSSPSVSMHLRHVDGNILPSPSPSPEPVLQHRLAALIIANRTPSPSPSVAETFPSEPPSPRSIRSTSSNTASNPDITHCCFFIDCFFYATAVTPPPSKTERERNQLPRAKQEMQHLPAVSQCTEITQFGAKCTRYCTDTEAPGSSPYVCVKIAHLRGRNLRYFSPFIAHLRA